MLRVCGARLSGKIGRFRSVREASWRFERLHLVHGEYANDGQQLIGERMYAQKLTNDERLFDTLMLLKNIPNLNITHISTLPLKRDTRFGAFNPREARYFNKAKQRDRAFSDFVDHLNSPDYTSHALLFNVPQLDPAFVALVQSQLHPDKDILILDRRRIILSIFYHNARSRTAFLETQLAELDDQIAESFYFAKHEGILGGANRERSSFAGGNR